MTELSSVLYPYWQTALLVVFVGIVAWAFWPSRKRKSEMQDHAEIPFRDDADDEEAARCR